MKKDSITSGGFKQWKNSSSRNAANTVDVTFLVVIAVRVAGRGVADCWYVG